MHSYYTDGWDSPRNMIRAAEDLNLSVAGFAEHVNARSEYWSAFEREVSHCRRKTSEKIKILKGMEVKVKDYLGNLDLPETGIPEADYVVGVVHSYPEPDGQGFITRLLTPDEAATLEYKALRALIESASCDVIGHIGGAFQTKFKRLLFPRAFRRKLLGLAKDMGRIVEFNVGHHTDTEGWMQDLRWSGVLISLASDAHKFSDVGKAYRIARDYYETR